MMQIHAYLTFNGQCKDAMNFYRDCLGGELTVMTAGESPMAQECLPEDKNKVMHSSLVKDGLMLMASDMTMAEGIIGNNISLSLTCTTEDELKTSFSNISAGGKVLQPLQAFFAGTIGNVTDKFGINWVFYHEKQLQPVA